MQILRPYTKFSESEWLLNTSAWWLWYEGHCACHDQRDFHMKMLTSLTSRYVTKLFSLSQCQDGFESKQSFSTITKDNYFLLGPALLYCLSLKEHNILKRIIISSFMCSKKKTCGPGTMKSEKAWIILCCYAQMSSTVRYIHSGK